MIGKRGHVAIDCASARKSDVMRYILSYLTHHIGFLYQRCPEFCMTQAHRRSSNRMELEWFVWGGGGAGGGGSSQRPFSLLQTRTLTGAMSTTSANALMTSATATPLYIRILIRNPLDITHIKFACLVPGAQVNVHTYTLQMYVQNTGNQIISHDLIKMIIN